MQIDGHTELIAHLGWPTHSFKAPMIYNPYFESVGVNAVVVPMGCRPETFAAVLRSLFTLENIRGALITMPHKVSVVDLLDEVTPTVKVAGSCNAVKRTPTAAGGRHVRRRGLRARPAAQGPATARRARAGGRLRRRRLGHRGVAGRGRRRRRSRCSTCTRPPMAGWRSACARTTRPSAVSTGSNDPAGFDLVVNATPLGMNPGDPLPMDMDRLDPAPSSARW
jgi:shikimate dehydrogenase